MASKLAVKHSVRWFVVAPDGTRTPKVPGVSIAGLGFDVVCSCGWDSRTGGAIFASVRRDVNRHREDAKHAVVRCDDCGEEHLASYHHEGQFGEGSLFEVECDRDYCVGYYAAERVYYV